MKCILRKLQESIILSKYLKLLFVAIACSIFLLPYFVRKATLFWTISRFNFVEIIHIALPLINFVTWEYVRQVTRLCSHLMRKILSAPRCCRALQMLIHVIIGNCGSNNVYTRVTRNFIHVMWFLFVFNYCVS